MPAKELRVQKLSLWDESIPFPDVSVIQEPSCLTHVSVIKAKPGEFNFLHECAIAEHEGAFYAAWANGTKFETNETDEIYRGAVSRDGGFTWSTPYVIGPGGLDGQIAHNHGSLFVRDGRLYAMVTRWEDRKPNVELFRLLDRPDRWESLGVIMRGFIPFNPPRRLAGGNWIIGGEANWVTAAAAVSHGDSLTQWDVVAICPGDGIELKYPEVTILPLADRLLAIVRSRRGLACALASIGSLDERQWEPIRETNFPAADAKLFVLTLSTGANCLISNLAPHRRTVLTVAIADAGKGIFNRVYKIRHCAHPLTRLYHPGWETQWSYPWAIEHDGKLHIIYTQGAEDAALTIVPVTAIAAE